ncbi:MFS transporter [Noviherbaspirillum aerium]|uniref:MFS transporter n=1 Tax=Noviherbaspirillum aerium TaxID=2588497 RepID=UPI00178C5AD5|nr:MFS transporter [Noviherbaspirillum aerium]
MILLSLTAHMALAGARITTSLYALSLHASEFTIGSLIALFSLFPMLFAVAAGRMVDRSGITRPLIGSALGIIIGCALPALFGGLAILYLATMLIGTGFMVIQVAAQHTVGALSSNENRASNYSWLALGFSVSGFCGPVLAGFLIDHASHRLSFAASAVSGMAALVLGVIGARYAGGFGGHGDKARVPARSNMANSMLDLVFAGEMRRIYIVGTLLSSAWDLFTFVLPIHATRLGFSASTIGLILGCFSAATFAVRLAMPWISRRHGEWQVLTGALLLAAACYALFPFMGRPLSLMAVSAMLGLAVGSSQPNMLALLHQHAPAGRAAEAVGVRVMIGNACQVLLPLAFGGAGAALGLKAVFWSMSVMIGAGVPLASRRIDGSHID